MKSKINKKKQNSHLRKQRKKEKVFRRKIIMKKKADFVRFLAKQKTHDDKKLANSTH